MERTCPSCGADPGAGSFCQHCGTSLTEQPAPEAPASQAPAAQAPPPAAATPPQIPAAQPAPKRRGLQGCLIVGLIVLALLVAVGFWVWGYITDEILPEVQETTDQFTLLSESPPGPCYDFELDGGFISGWDEVSCDGPRQAEVSFAAAFEDNGTYPGDGYLDDTATDTCRTAFENYVGLTPEDSTYDVDWLTPTEELWGDGVRNGICLVVSDDGSPLTGTVKGSER